MTLYPIVGNEGREISSWAFYAACLCTAKMQKTTSKLAIVGSSAMDLTARRQLCIARLMRTLARSIFCVGQVNSSARIAHEKERNLARRGVPMEQYRLFRRAFLPRRVQQQTFPHNPDPAPLCVCFEGSCQRSTSTHSQPDRRKTQHPPLRLSSSIQTPATPSKALLGKFILSSRSTDAR